MPISNNATPSTISSSAAVTPDFHDIGKYPEYAAERSNKSKSCIIQGINTRFLGEELSQECLQDDVEDEDFEMDDEEEDVINKLPLARAASIEYDADGTPTNISYPASLRITGASDGSFRSSLTSRWNSRVSALGFGSFSIFKSFSKEISPSEGPKKMKEEEVHHENLICGSF